MGFINGLVTYQWQCDRRGTWTCHYKTNMSENAQLNSTFARIQKHTEA